MASTRKYDHTKIEKKWQMKWLETKIYNPDLLEARRPFYNLFMFPYPSAEGMHTGHAMSSTGSDVIGRFKRMNGFDVFQPMGYDSFGIHAENYAIKVGMSPQEMLSRVIPHFSQQFESFGHGYDWSHVLNTSDPDYYRWTQWIFLQLFKAGLAYRKKALLNFCPKDKTVLADEQVMTPKQAGKDPVDINGNPVVAGVGIMVCERCGTVVEKREVEVWFFRITDYAERLLRNLKKIDWSLKVKVAQRQWIGKSKGIIIKFKKEDGGVLEVFTTRPDTLDSATFLALSDRELYEKHKSDKDKFGEFVGKYAINPINNRRMPIWKASYVDPNYSTGCVMGVPAYDERDRSFAAKYKIEVVEKPTDARLWKKLTKDGTGRLHVNYHLRDWGIGRQRYWGCPIPMIFCQTCHDKGLGWIGLNKRNMLHDNQDDWDWRGWWPEDNLPVILPRIKEYKPQGNGRGPLANHPEFYETKCPHCGSKAERETDVADTFLDSSWYFLRYPSSDDKQFAWNPRITKKWLPVDLYFGGAEHSVLHLMYARFVTMVFKDLKLIDHFEEPFTKFFAHGLVIKDGAKMSKSRGNVVNPDDYVKKFGADTLRLYLLFMGPIENSTNFRDEGVEGMHRFVKRLWSLFYPVTPYSGSKKELLAVLNRTIKKVTEDIEVYHYNTAISAIMELVNFLKEKGSEENSLSVLCQLIAPFAPHLAEELWVEALGKSYSVHKTSWPKYDARYLETDRVTIIAQVDGKVRSKFVVDKALSSRKDKIKDIAMADEKVRKWIDGREIDVIFIPGKIINFVTTSGGGTRTS